MLTAEVEKKLGKRLTTPDVGVLLGLNDYLGLPADVIFLLVNHCVERVTRKLPGVARSEVNLTTGIMTIAYDESQCTQEQIVAKVEKAGFGVVAADHVQAGGHQAIAMPANLLDGQDDGARKGFGAFFRGLQKPLRRGHQSLRIAAEGYNLEPALHPPSIGNAPNFNGIAGQVGGR